jgi:hypothetical protein
MKKKIQTKILSLAEQTEDALFYTPLMVLEDAIKDIKEGRRDPNKILIIMLDDRDNRYKTTWYNGGMSFSRMLALVEVFKARLIKDWHDGEL